MMRIKGHAKRAASSKSNRSTSTLFNNNNHRLMLLMMSSSSSLLVITTIDCLLLYRPLYINWMNEWMSRRCTWSVDVRHLARDDLFKIIIIFFLLKCTLNSWCSTAVDCWLKSVCSHTHLHSTASLQHEDTLKQHAQCPLIFPLSQ